jgi:hypothetical protein
MTAPACRTRLRVGTWNMLRDRPDGQVRGDIHQLLADHPGLHALALQEVRDYHDVLRKVPGWNWYGTTEGPRGADQNGWLVREDVQADRLNPLDLGGDGWTTTTGHHHVGAIAMGIRLETWLYGKSLHLPVSVDWRHGRPVGPAERVDDYKANMRHLLVYRHQVHPDAISGLSMIRQRDRYGSDHPLVTFTVSRVRDRTGLLYVGDWNCRPGRDEGRFSVSWLGMHARMSVGKPTNATGHLSGIDLPLLAR